jgi:TATA-box binding protein (TBP) (component of TFIID and TFIIIB)
MNFEDIKVSTKTYIANTNITIDLEKLYDVIPITFYKIVEKKRGRKKQKDKKNETTENNVKWGSIISIKYKDQHKGANFNNKKNCKWFRNSFTIIIFLDKKINFKICKNGTFQITGCKHVDHAIECIVQIWKILKKHNKIYSIQNNDDKIVCHIVPAMRNIDFSLGFNIDRQKLARKILEDTKFHCLLETSFGYTGVNIKMPCKQQTGDMKIYNIILNKKNDTIKVKKIIYDRYINTLNESQQQIKRKQKYNTFLVFHSGKVIMSGVSSEFMKNDFYSFISFIKKNKNQIIEKLN